MKEREFLDWVEQAGLENLKSHRETADLLQKQAVTTLTVLLAGATGGLAFAVKGVEHGSLWWAIGSAAFSVYLYLLCALLVFKTLTIKDFPSLYNEPQNLFQPTFRLEEVKVVELDNIQKRIEQAGARNGETSNWLNGTRYAAVASPIVFVIVALVVTLAVPSDPVEAEEHTASAQVFQSSQGLAVAPQV